MRRTTRAGFSLVEVLVALALMAALLAAVAVGVDATLDSYAANEDIALVTQAGRWAIDRMTTDIRQASAVETSTGRVAIIPPDNGSGVTQIVYEYVDGKLYYERTTGAGTTSQVLLGDDEVSLDTFTVTRVLGENYEGVTCTKNVTLELDFSMDGESFSISGSAAPRRNQLF